MAAVTTYAVLGLGLFGSSIARTLTELGHHVLAIDRDLTLVESLGGNVAEAVQADATDREALSALHISRYDLVFNAIGDLAGSILSTLALRELGVRRIIAKINSPRQGRILTRLGVEHILFPERDMGERVARQVASGAVVTLDVDLARDVSLWEVTAPRALAGRSLAEAAVRRRFGVTVVAIRRRRARDRTGELVISPPPDLVIGQHDLVLVAGKNEDLLRLQRSEQ